MKNIAFILILIIGLNFTTTAQTKTPSGENAVTAKLVNFYPNPASAAITFEFTKEYQGAYSLQVFNFMGKKVYDVKKLPSRLIINLDDFFRGVYIFQLRDKMGTVVQSGKFQVVK